MGDKINYGVGRIESDGSKNSKLLYLIKPILGVEPTKFFIFIHQKLFYIYHPNKINNFKLTFKIALSNTDQFF